MLLLLLVVVVNWPIIPQRWWSYDSVGPQLEPRWGRKCRRMTIWCSTSREISNPLPASKEASPYGNSRPARFLPPCLFVYLAKGESVRRRSAWSCLGLWKGCRTLPGVARLLYFTPRMRWAFTESIYPPSLAAVIRAALFNREASIRKNLRDRAAVTMIGLKEILFQHRAWEL